MESSPVTEGTLCGDLKSPESPAVSSVSEGESAREHASTGGTLDEGPEVALVTNALACVPVPSWDDPEPVGEEQDGTRPQREPTDALSLGPPGPKPGLYLLVCTSKPWRTRCCSLSLLSFRHSPTRWPRFPQ